MERNAMRFAMVGLLVLAVTGSVVRAGDVLTVVGVAELRAVPDEATLSYAVLTDDPTPEGARKKHEEVLAKCRAALAKHGVKSKNVSTPAGRPEGYFPYWFDDYYPWWYWGHYGDQYRIQTTVTVKITELADVDGLFRDLMDAGINVPQLTFKSSKLQEYRLTAFSDAVKAAQRKATAMAAAVGQQIGRATSIAERPEDDGGYWGYRHLATANTVSNVGSDAAGAGNFPGGQTTIRARVAVTFELR